MNRYLIIGTRTAGPVGQREAAFLAQGREQAQVLVREWLDGQHHGLWGPGRLATSLAPHSKVEVYERNALMHHFQLIPTESFIP